MEEVSIGEHEGREAGTEDEGDARKDAVGIEAF